jgi:hypothetical protein
LWIREIVIIQSRTRYYSSRNPGHVSVCSVSGNIIWFTNKCQPKILHASGTSKDNISEGPEVLTERHITPCSFIYPYFLLLPLKHRQSVNRFVSLRFRHLTVRRTPWTGDQPVARPLPTQDNTNTEKCRETSVPQRDSNPRSQSFNRWRHCAQHNAM